MVQDEEYVVLLKDNSDEQFSTEKLFLVAKGSEGWMKKLAEIAGELKSKHLKHLIRLLESGLRANPTSEMYGRFDSGKADMAVLIELDTPSTSNQNVRLTEALVELARYYKIQSSNLKDENERFASLVAEQLSLLVGKFRETLADPEAFHQYKKNWIIEFNNKKPKTVIRKPV